MKDYLSERLVSIDEAVAMDRQSGRADSKDRHHEFWKWQTAAGTPCALDHLAGGSIDSDSSSQWSDAVRSGTQQLFKTSGWN
jgi:hypothetical protein